MAKVSKKRWLPWIMILPVILIRGITTVYPVFMTFINSFRNLNVIQGGKGEFIGLQNYARMLSDEKIATSLGFTLIFTMVSMIFHIILGIVLALILNMKFKGKKFLRTIVLIPWAMPMIVAGRAARWGFNGQYGFVNDLIGRFVENFHYDWLIDVDSARIAVIIVDLWKDIPYFAILVLAALQYISGDIYEAAKIDGCGEFRILFRIVMPLIKPALATVGLFIALAYWNDWYNAMLYIKDTNKYPLQYFLYQQVNDIEAYKKLLANNAAGSAVSAISLPTQSLKMALTIVVTGPIVLAYPLVQKYFVQGITIGAVKG